MRGYLVMVQYSAHPYLHKIIHFFFTNFYKVKVKGFNFYYCYSESSPNGNLCPIQALYFYIPISSQLLLQTPFLCPNGVC